MPYYETEPTFELNSTSHHVAEVMTGCGISFLSGLLAVPKAIEWVFTHDPSTAKASTALTALAVAGYFAAKHGIKRLGASEQNPVGAHEIIG